MRPFLGLAPSKLKKFSKKFNGSICAYRVFYPPIFRRIGGGSLRYRKKRGPERVKRKFKVSFIDFDPEYADYFW